MADIGALIADSPPVSRVLAGSTLLLSFGAWALGLVHPAQLIYWKDAVFNLSRPEIWRLVTSFLLTGPKMGILMDSFFLYRYASDCETQRFTRSGDFVTFLVFCGATILGLNTAIPYLSGNRLGPALMLSFAYYFTAFEPAGARVNFFIATFPAKLLPYIILLMTFVQAGMHETLVEATGLLAAHLYLFLTEIYPRFGGGPEVIFTPNWLHRWFEVAPEAPPPRRASIRPDIPPRVAPAPGGVPVGGAPGASGSSIFNRATDSWSHRGQGQRLGS